MTENENNNNFKPRIQNIHPFKHKLNLNTYYNYFKLTFMSIFVLPLRVIGIMTCLIIAYVMASFALWGITDEELEARPLPGWRRRVRSYMFTLGRTLIRFFAYNYVTVKGKCASAEEAPIMVAGPHSSFFDGIAVWWSADACPGVVSRVENNDIPFFGKCIRFIQSVHVERQAEKSRKSSVKEIIDRVNSKENWPQILIFPEGTCSNGKSLISFKRGAFLPGVPVQPVIIRYHNKSNCTVWTIDGPGPLKIIWSSLCQFHSFCEIEYLPVYTPSPIEKQDALVYANNVRNVMARALGIPVTDYSFEDAKLVFDAKNHDLPSESGLIEFQKLRHDYGVDLKSVREDFLSQFAKMAKICKRNGLVDIQGFANGLYLPVSEPLVVKLFNSFDLAGRGTLNFQEYTYGRCEHTRRFKDPSMFEQTYAFFGLSSFEGLSLHEFSKEMSNNFGVQAENCRQIFKLAGVADDGLMSEDDYKKLAKIAPEYIWIIYHRVQNGFIKDKNSKINCIKSKPE